MAGSQSGHYLEDAKSSTETSGLSGSKLIYLWLASLTGAAALTLGIIIPELLSLKAELEVLSRTALTTSNVVTEVENALGSVSVLPAVDLGVGTTINGVDVIQGITGPKGDKGDQGNTGPQGPPGLDSVFSQEYVEELGPLTGASGGVTVTHDLELPVKLVYLVGTCVGNCQTYDVGDQLILFESHVCINSCSGYGVEMVGNSTIILQIHQDGLTSSQNRLAPGSPGSNENLQPFDWTYSVHVLA